MPRTESTSQIGCSERQLRRVVMAGALGNMLEWYDFGIYGLLAPVLAVRFFPAHDRVASLLGVYGGFAVGFAMRPIGALVLGRVGDRMGRKHLLTLSVLLMGTATAAIGLLPTYASAGLSAVVLLILARLFQGFSVGGEFVGSVTYLVESARPRRRGLSGSVSNLGATVGMLLAAGVAAVVTAASGLDAGWAWRAAFFFGGGLAAAAYALRRHLPELPMRERPRAPLRLAWREGPGLLLFTIVFTSGYGIVNYLAMVLLPTFASQFGHVAPAAALRVNAVGQALALGVVPLAGWLSDHAIRRRTLLLLGFLAEAALAWPSFAWARQPGIAGLWAGQLLLAAMLALVMGAAPAMLAEQFPAAYRVTAHAVAFNLGIGVAGGTAPLVALALVRASGDPMAAAAYLVFAALLAAAGLLGLRDRSRESLSH